MARSGWIPIWFRAISGIEEHRRDLDGTRRVGGSRGRRAVGRRRRKGAVYGGKEDRGDKGALSRTISTAHCTTLVAHNSDPVQLGSFPRVRDYPLYGSSWLRSLTHRHKVFSLVLHRRRVHRPLIFFLELPLAKIGGTRLIVLFKILNGEIICFRMIKSSFGNREALGRVPFLVCRLRMGCCRFDLVLDYRWIDHRLYVANKRVWRGT